MKLNKDVAIATSKLLLVPYEASHVSTYHVWMQDEEIREATASEPLSLDEEYEMQEKWRNDHDKLTFIICEPLTPQEVDEIGEIEGGVQDEPKRMLGDVNLFISVSDEDEEDIESDQESSSDGQESGSDGKESGSDGKESGSDGQESGSDEEESGRKSPFRRGCVGELELMIASPSKRRQGYGRAAIATFIHYIAMNLHDIRNEFLRGIIPTAFRSLSEHSHTPYPNWAHLDHDFKLKVKIGEDNESSIKLFESLGFVRKGQGANYFGELELVLPEYVTEEWTKGLMDTHGVEGYEELVYMPLVV